MSRCLLFAKVFTRQTFSQGERTGLLEGAATASSSEVFFKELLKRVSDHYYFNV